MSCDKNNCPVNAQVPFSPAITMCALANYEAPRSEMPSDIYDE